MYPKISHHIKNLSICVCFANDTDLLKNKQFTRVVFGKLWKIDKDQWFVGLIININATSIYEIYITKNHWANTFETDAIKPKHWG